jgi:DNA-directed RNA polymerase specialized sigma24 family protein
VQETQADSFTEFFREHQHQLAQALTASLGTELGAEATSEALSYGWEHWERVRGMEHPVGYLYRVGRSRALRFHRRRPPPVLPTVRPNPMPWVEPGLPNALARLSEKQRLAVILIHSMGWTHREVASLCGVTIATVQTHAERGLKRLRATLGVAA